MCIVPAVSSLSILLTAVFAVSRGKPDFPFPVYGITDRSVDLILREEGTGPVREIYWTFQTFILAHFLNNHLDVKNDEFDNRLEILDNGTRLRIRNLRKEDGGIYSATVQYTDKRQHSDSYILIVYDPVPSPSIQTEWEEDTAERCNFTLQCSVTANISDLSYSWKSRHQDSTYQPYGNGRTLQISLPPDHQDMEIMCIVQNPADHKNVSITVGHGCQHLDTLGGRKGDGRHYYMLLLIPLAVLAGISGLFLFKLYNKKEKAEKKGRKESKEMSEIHYADLALRPNSCEQRASPKNEESTQETVYSAVVS